MKNFQCKTRILLKQLQWPTPQPLVFVIPLVMKIPWCVALSWSESRLQNACVWLLSLTNTMVGLNQQSAPKQLINEVPSHVVLVYNKVGAKMLGHLKTCYKKVVVHLSWSCPGVIVYRSVTVTWIPSNTAIILSCFNFINHHHNDQWRPWGEA